MRLKGRGEPDLNVDTSSKFVAENIKSMEYIVGANFSTMSDKAIITDVRETNRNFMCLSMVSLNDSLIKIKYLQLIKL